MNQLLAASLIAVAGMLAGRYLWIVAQYYERLSQADDYPDAGMLRRALARALLPGSFWSKALTRPIDPTFRPWPTAVPAAALAIVYTMLYGLLGIGLLSVSLAWAAGVLLLLALLDAHCGLLPDALTLPLLWGGLALAWSGQGFITLDQAFACAALAYLALRLLSGLYRLIRGKDGLGGGDIKLMSAIGAWLGWPDVFCVLVAGSVAGLLYAAAISRRLRLADEYPFGPALILAALMILVFRVTERAGWAPV